MKKSVLFASAIALLGMATVGQAATSLNYTMTVTITVAPIDITGPWADGSFITFGGTGVNTSVLNASLPAPGNWTINNIGSTAVDLSLSVTAPSAYGWNYLDNGAPATTQPGDAQYRLSALFTQWDRAGIGEADFAANDVLTTTPTLCSDAQFAYDSESDINFKGYNMPTGASRNMFVLLEIGTQGTATGGTLAPVIHIAASAH